MQQQNIGHAFSVHPGNIVTPLALPYSQYGIPTQVDSLAVKAVVAASVLKSVEQGAATTTYVASSNDEIVMSNAGGYFVDCFAAAHSANLNDAQALWDLSEKQIAEWKAKRTQ
jgi:hypothetical protein